MAVFQNTDKNKIYLKTVHSARVSEPKKLFCKCTGTIFRIKIVVFIFTELLKYMIINWRTSFQTYFFHELQSRFGWLVFHLSRQNLHFPYVSSLDLEKYFSIIVKEIFIFLHNKVIIKYILFSLDIEIHLF